jgi:hypothetical protein
MVHKRMAIDETNWNHMRRFIAERFDANSPATTEGTLEFINETFGVSLSPDALQCKLREETVF